MPDHEPAKRRDRFLLWGRVLLGAGVLVFVLSRLELDEVWTTLQQPVWTGIALAALVQVAHKVALAQRWKDLLGAVGIRRRLWDLVALVLVGMYFNLFLPTAIGGDVARGFYVSRRSESLTGSYAVLAVERFLGLVTMAALVTAATAVMLAVGQGPLPAPVLWTLLLSGVGTLTVGLIVFSWRRWSGLLSVLSRFGDSMGRLGEALSDGLLLFHKTTAHRFRIVLLSLVLQLAGVLFYFGCAIAVGLETGLLTFFLVVPAAVVVSMLPLTLNGLGLREGTVTGLLVLQGADPARVGGLIVVSLFLLTIVSLSGGVIHLIYKSPRQRNGENATPSA